MVKIEPTFDQMQRMNNILFTASGEALDLLREILGDIDLESDDSFLPTANFITLQSVSADLDNALVKFGLAFVESMEGG